MHQPQGRTKPTRRSESERRRRSAEARSCKGASPVDLTRADERERIRWAPKDGELCLRGSKPEETLVENGSNSDVQIDYPTWALGQKTNQTVWYLVPSEVSHRSALCPRFYMVMRMITGLLAEAESTYSQTLNR